MRRIVKRLGWCPWLMDTNITWARLPGGHFSHIRGTPGELILKCSKGPVILRIKRTMKKLLILPLALMMGLGTLKSQAILAEQNNTEKKDVPEKKSATVHDAFIDRYYDFKDSYPLLKSAHGNYAASSYDKKKFIERYYQIRSSYPKLKETFGDYAGSEYALEDFIKRYYEMKDSYPELVKYCGDYAASNKTLPEFIKRYYEIKESAPDLKDFCGQYAASDNSLSEFSTRYYGVKASKTGMLNCFGEYAGCNRKLANVK
jgi:hypothetical protein